MELILLVMAIAAVCAFVYYMLERSDMDVPTDAEVYVEQPQPDATYVVATSDEDPL